MTTVATSRRPDGSGARTAPPRRTRRSAWRDADFVALDFETTGLDPGSDHVVSFGAVPVRGGRVVLAGARYVEVAPPSWPSHRSVPIHQLRPADLAAAPPMSEAREQLGDMLARRYLVCWAAGVEAGFLDALFGGGSRRWLRRTVDVLPMTTSLEHIERWDRADLRLASVAGRYGVPVDRPHHALGDALMTAQLFLVIGSKLESLGYKRVRDLLRLTR